MTRFTIYGNEIDIPPGVQLMLSPASQNVYVLLDTSDFNYACPVLGEIAAVALFRLNKTPERTARAFEEEIRWIVERWIDNA